MKIGNTWWVMLIVFVILACGFGSFTEAASGETIKKEKLTEKGRLCDKNQLNEKYTNPTCQGWQAYSNIDDIQILANTYPDACAYGVGLNAQNEHIFTCYFRLGKDACIANAKSLENDGTEFTKYCACGQTTDATTFRCGHCTEQEGCSSNGNFESGTICPNSSPFQNDYNIFLLPIPSNAYHKYCAIQVNGPYSNMANADGSESYTVCGTTYTETYPGMPFVHDQRKRIIAVNMANNNNKIKSDLAGFCYPKPKESNCIKRKFPRNPNICVEPDFLVKSQQPWAYKPNAAQVHHVVPAHDRRGCPCGKNSVKNAAVISAQLNTYFTNKNRTGFLFNCDSGMTEIEKVNSLPKYDPSLVSSP